jgi:hypothetical protein
MIFIDNILIDPEIPSTQFLCDLKRCKGACCTFPGEFGAPVLDEEVPLLEQSLEVVKKYLSKKSLDIIDKNGVVEGFAGAYTTVCIDKKDCVFVYYDGVVAKCSIEKAYLEGELNFRKPISCHLFPIRVKEYGGIYLQYEKISECKPALRNGADSGVMLHEMLREALTRAYGKEWYKKLNSYINAGSTNDK